MERLSERKDLSDAAQRRAAELLASAASATIDDATRRRIRRAVLTAPRGRRRVWPLLALALVGTTALASVVYRWSRPVTATSSPAADTQGPRARLVPKIVPGRLSPTPPPGPASLTWRADHEDGTFDEWRPGGLGHGGVGETPGTKAVISDARAHGGRRAIRFVTENGDHEDYFQALAWTEGVAPEEARYGAWFFLPESVRPRAFWGLMKIRSRVDASNDATWLDVWDLLVVRRRDGRPTLELFHAGGVRTSTPSHELPELPVGRWFHLEVDLRARPDDTGRLVVRLDGRQVFALDRVATLPSRWLRFSVGSFSRGFVEGRGEVWVDDATISAESPAD